MVDISFEVNGRKVRPNDVGDALTNAILNNAAEQIKKRVGAVRCPEHGKTPKIICKGRSIEKLNFEVSGCCEALIGAVKQKLS